MEHYYIVNGDSSLGVRIEQYFQRCQKVDSDIDAFIQILPEQYGLHLLDKGTQLCYADDCDAGGLIRISFQISNLVNSEVKPNPLVWDSFPDPDDDDRVCYAPRIQPHSRFVRYGQALKMSERDDWEFVPAKHALAKKGFPLQVYMFGDVRQHILPENRKELQYKGQDPAYSLRLAFGTHLALVHEGITYLPERLLNHKDGTPAQSETTDLNIEYISDDLFDLALQLYKSWAELPSVPANTLARILALEWNGSKDTDSNLRDNAYCHCIPDPDATKHRFIIHTGLTSRLTDMQEVSPTQSIIEAFNRK